MWKGFWDEPAGFWITVVLGGIALGLFGHLILAVVVGCVLGTASAWVVMKVLGLK